MRTSFYEEFKISSWNFVICLFESVLRIMTTIDEHNEFINDKSQSKKSLETRAGHFSKDYRRFLESKTKDVDQFVVNCIGWAHVLRMIDVLDMTVRDLVYKVVPSSAIIRDLKTTQGKTLT